MAHLVFVDANVFYSRTLRDWLFLLRQETRGDVFTLASTWDILTEAGSRLRNQYPASAGNLVSQLIKKCELYLDDIIEDYPGGPVPWIVDHGDWHVHHAATASGASYLLAQDKGFDDTHSSYTLNTCDEFFTHIYELAPAQTQAVIEQQACYWSQRSQAKTLPEALRAAQCPNFANIVETYLNRQNSNDGASSRNP